MSKKKKKKNRSKWMDKIMCTEKDIISAMEFFDHFNIAVDPIAKATVDKLKAGAPITLADQRIITRFITASVAASLNKVYQDKILNQVRIDCAESLADANRKMASE